MNIEQRYIDIFWSKITQGPGCWSWSGAHCRDGYGLFGIRHVGQFKAHRFVLMSTGQQIAADQVVMHLCDNPGCVNPAHLRVGSVQENNLDKLRKGRQRGAAGSRNGRSRLTESLVQQIRQDPRHYTEIARDLRVHEETVRMAKTKTTWRHV